MSSAIHANKRSSFATRETGLYCGVKNKILYNKHGCKTKNQEVVGAMYAMYCLPRSLEQVGLAYRKPRQAIYHLFKSRGYKMRSKKMLGLQVLDGIKFTRAKSGYLRGTVNKKRTLMHYYVWEKYHGKLECEYCIYHKDKNKENNKLFNLGIVRKEMMSYKFDPKNIKKKQRKP